MTQHNSDLSPPTERDRIADEVGVSARTVKRALEGSPDVSSETRRKIDRAREKLGFGRAPQALVGLVVPEFHNPFFVQLATAIDSRMAQQGVKLVPGPWGGYRQREYDDIQWMLGMRVSGVFYAQNPPYANSLAVLQQARDVSVVLVDIEDDDMDADAVLADNSAGIDLAVAHLAIENGHEHLGFLAGPPGWTTADARKTAFHKATEEHGLRQSDPLILQGDYSYESGRNAAIELAKLKRQGAELPSAIVSANDLMALGLMKGLRSMTIHVPDEISVVGFDNIDASAWSTPELTSIDQRIDEIAERAVRLMAVRLEADLADEPQRKGRKELVRPVLVPRKSVRDVRSATS